METYYERKDKRDVRSMARAPKVFSAALALSIVLVLMCHVADSLAVVLVPTASMAVQRSDHAAVLLQDGRALVTGGGTATAELYNVNTASWSSAGNLATGRFSHAAVLLQNGKVLVTGGALVGTPQALGSAEMYDPGTNSWSGVPNMIGPRQLHTCTTLPDGRALVVGGLGGNELASVEIYDPVADTWTPGPSLAMARWGHSATLLQDGRVLVAGGTNGARNVHDAEIYDPATNLWSTAGALITLRSSHSATLLGNGKVLVAGGIDQQASGWESLGSAELYDPVSAKWTAVAPLGSTRSIHTASLLSNGMVLVVGGAVMSNPQIYAETYDPSTDKWTAVFTGTESRAYHRATALANGDILIAGGAIASGPFAGSLVDTAELFKSNAAAPVMLSAASRRTHGAAGTFDLPIALSATNPTTEPRVGPVRTIVATFDRPIAGATFGFSEDSNVASASYSVSGNDLIVEFPYFQDQKYVTLVYQDVIAVDGTHGLAGLVRVGFLLGDVNQSRQVTVGDVGIVNAALLQTVTSSNFLKDVNADGHLTVADKGLANANLLKKLPAP